MANNFDKKIITISLTQNCLKKRLRFWTTISQIKTSYLQEITYLNDYYQNNLDIKFMVLLYIFSNDQNEISLARVLHLYQILIMPQPESNSSEVNLSLLCT